MEGSNLSGLGRVATDQILIRKWLVAKMGKRMGKEKGRAGLKRNNVQCVICNI